MGADKLIASSLGHFDNSEYRRQRARGVAGAMRLNAEKLIKILQKCVIQRSNNMSRSESVLPSCASLQLRTDSDRTKHASKNPAMDRIERIPVNETAQTRGIEKGRLTNRRSLEL